MVVGATTYLTLLKRKIILFLLADLQSKGYTPVSIDEQPWSVNKLDLRGYSLRGRKCCKNPKATIPPMTFTLAVTPEEVIGLSFVVNANIGIYFADFLRDVMLKLREK